MQGTFAVSSCGAARSLAPNLPPSLPLRGPVQRQNQNGRGADRGTLAGGTNSSPSAEVGLDVHFIDKCTHAEGRRPLNREKVVAAPPQVSRASVHRDDADDVKPGVVDEHKLAELLLPDAGNLRCEKASRGEHWSEQLDPQPHPIEAPAGVGAGIV